MPVKEAVCVDYANRQLDEKCAIRSASGSPQFPKRPGVIFDWQGATGLKHAPSCVTGRRGVPLVIRIVTGYFELTRAEKFQVEEACFELGEPFGAEPKAPVPSA